MVRSRRLAAVVVALAVPLVGTLVAAGPAAAKKVVATGSITCQLSQTLSFDPPLVPGVAGTAGYSVDKITISPAQISNCTGTVRPTGALPQLGTGTKSIVLKMKGSKVGGVAHAGSCNQLVDFLWPRIKPHYNWSATGLTVKGTKVSGVVEQNGVGPGGVLGFEFNGHSGGSFAGLVSIDAFLTPASSTAFENCKANVGTVPSLTIDPTTSTITVG